MGVIARLIEDEKSTESSLLQRGVANVRVGPRPERVCAGPRPETGSRCRGKGEGARGREGERVRGRLVTGVTSATSGLMGDGTWSEGGENWSMIVQLCPLWPKPGEVIINKYATRE